MGKLLFVVLRDMYGAVQVTFDLSNATPELEKQINELSIECVISVEVIRICPKNFSTLETFYFNVPKFFL